VATAKKLARKLAKGPESIQPTLIVLGELRRAVKDGKPVHVLLMHIEELSDLLLGVVTPATLFK